MNIALSRRHFLWAASAGVLAAGLPISAWRLWQVSEAGAAVRPRYFTDPADFATLQDLVDLIIPPDFDFTGMPSPGAKAAGVADYIDFLLGAFLGSAPFIFAGGPFSNRNPFNGEGLIDNMAVPTTLTPLQRLAWRIRILGTKGAATNVIDTARITIVKANNILAGVGDANGDVEGFQQQYSAGIAALRAAAKTNFGKDFPALTTTQQQTLFNAADPTFVALITNHAAEGMYGNPEYGGNQPPNRTIAATGADGDNRPIGWVIANFEGDRQPLGYTTFDAATQTSVEEPNHPVSTPDPGDVDLADLEPKARETMRQVAQAMSGFSRRRRS
jgi:Gluconate 2-dehydrogenase subunit 3